MIDACNPKNEQVIIVDKTNNNKVIAAGRIVNNKNIPVNCITLDNKFYFLMDKNDLYEIYLRDEELHTDYHIIYNGTEDFEHLGDCR